MGMVMDDIHTPSVASGERSGRDQPNAVVSDKSSLMELIAEKDRVQSELSALSSVLHSVSCGQESSKLASLWLIIHCRQHGVTMNTSLTTFDGYPRDDIDVARSV